MERERRRVSAFEVTFVLGLIVVIAALAIPIRARTCVGGRYLDCRHSLKQIGVYFSLYESLYGRYPEPGPDWFAALMDPKLATDGNLFRCAVRGKSGMGCHYMGISGPWVWNGGGSGKPYTVPPWGPGAGTPPGLPLASDMPGNHPDKGTMNVLFFSGRTAELDLDHPAARDAALFLNPTGWYAPTGKP